MINLNNLTVSFKSNYGTKLHIKSNINGYTPIVCIKPFIIEKKQSDMYWSLDKTLYNFTSNKELFKNLGTTDFLKKFKFVDYYLANRICDNRMGSGYRRDLAGESKEKLELYSKKAIKELNEVFKDYSASTDYITNEVTLGASTEAGGYHHVFGSTGVDFNRGSYKYLLHLDHHFSYKGMLNSTYLFVSKGFCGVYNSSSKELIPLVMLMIKGDYIPYYRCANLLEMPIDNSKFEIWINDKIEESTCYNFIIKYVLKAENCVNSTIPVLVKTNLDQHFGNIKVPEFSSITERIEWLGSTKNDFLNEFYSLKEKLPVKDFKVDAKPIETIQKKFKSRNLNKIISSAVKLTDIKEVKEVDIPKTIPKDKFTLTI